MSLEAFQLNGKTALVTGSRRGIGAAIAVALAEAGADVACHGQNPDPGGACDKIHALGRRTEYFEADITNAHARTALFEKVLSTFGRLDVLVNNAGPIRRAAAAEYSMESWEEMIEAHLSAVFHLSQLAGQEMLSRKMPGKILNIASLLSFQGGIRVAGYSAAKAGVAGLTKAMANEWASKGINVNAIAPGYIITDNTAALREDPARNQQILSRIPAGRWGEPADVAGAAVFLCSAASNYVHGHVLAVDGGWLAF
ncbi:MAG TPA: 2-dehydro-3-deoxy-D-gluconate 5-dehydrogenase KduD [Dongiaceae bacterium]|nr:2-dehydro-3-deoxy-D-gluconate 5-dehydrogenase KduD [Dongiaceae bacterium]